MDLQTILNATLPLSDLSPNVLALFEKRGGGIILARILGMLSTLKAKTGLEELQHHPLVNALEKISEFLGIWRDLYAALDAVQDQLADFPLDGWLGTGFGSSSASSSASFIEWLKQLETQLASYSQFHYH